MPARGLPRLSRSSFKPGLTAAGDIEGPEHAGNTDQDMLID